MPNYKQTCISQMDYEKMKRIGHPYAGYVENFGYVSFTIENLRPNYYYNYNLSDIRALPTEETSDKIKLRSLLFSATNRSKLEKALYKSLIVDNNDGNITLYLSKNKTIVLPKNNNNIQINFTTTPASHDVKLTISGGDLKKDPEFSDSILSDFKINFGDDIYQKLKNNYENADLMDDGYGYEYGNTESWLLWAQSFAAGVIQTHNTILHDTELAWRSTELSPWGQTLINAKEFHYIMVNPKYLKYVWWAGKVGRVGDFLNLFGVGYNIFFKEDNHQFTTYDILDLIMAGVGFSGMPGALYSGYYSIEKFNTEQIAKGRAKYMAIPNMYGPVLQYNY